MNFQKKHCVAMLLAGGQGSRLMVLTENTAKPAVPFGGKYRIIDFPLSNCVNSGIDTIGVLTPTGYNASLSAAETQMAASRRVLAEHGNCSSATVLLVLDELADADGPVVAMAFGPGLTLYATLLLPA